MEQGQPAKLIGRFCGLGSEPNLSAITVKYFTMARIILEEDYTILKNILNRGNRLIDAAYSKWDGKTDDWDIWMPVYERIFSKDMSRVIWNKLPGFDPYIPDTTYQEDVCAFWRAFNEEMDNAEVV